MNNKDIRRAIQVAGLKHWEVASMIPLSDSSLSRWLRLELEEDKKTILFEAIEKAKEVYGK